MWTERVRERAVRALPPEKLLPDRQPAYVSSWIYVFGVATIAALIVVVGLGRHPWPQGAGLVARLRRREVLQQHPPLGRRDLLLHHGRAPVGKFFMGAWRGGRSWTWVDRGGRLPGLDRDRLHRYLSQQNFDSQWIASEGKDGLNSVGIGAFFNVIDFGQMYTWHVILLPVAVVALVAWHVLLVRTHGVVPPYAAKAARCLRRRRSCGMSAPAPTATPAPLESAEWHGRVRPLRPGQGVRHRAGGGHCAGRSSSRSSSPPRTTAPRRSSSGPAPTRATSWPPR